MKRVSPLRAGAIAAISAAVAIGAIPASATSLAAHPSKAADRVKAASAAAWQASQLTKGRIHNGQFGSDDWGLTVDTALALAATGTEPTKLAAAGQAIENHYFEDYVQFGGDFFAGATAKALVAAEVLGADATTFGGHDVRALMMTLVAPGGAGFEAGRVRDQGTHDFSTVFAQSYAVIGLAGSGGVPQRVVNYLLKQQCSDGYFRLNEVVRKSCDGSAPKNKRPDVDATALAIQALRTAADGGATVPAGVINDAAKWLVSVQGKNGSFGGGQQTAGKNSNSTGLAAAALVLTGRDQAARDAADWVAALQITRRNADKPAARKDVGAIAYNHAGLANALKNGIQTIERDQFRRATAQAIFAFKPVSLGTLTAA